jgi:broad specificity phosphatase PhoE
VELWLARHGETEWTLSRQHTGVTDIPLTANGEEQARLLGNRLRDVEFDVVVSSPATRARLTADLAGFANFEIDEDFVEYNYGEYEGITTAEIRKTRPDWDLWRDGCPGGETTAETAARADRVIERIRSRGGEAALVFGHGHMSRVLSARWLGLDGTAGRYLIMQTATLSIIGVEHGHPAIRLWNDGSHLTG